MPPRHGRRCKGRVGSAPAGSIDGGTGAPVRLGVARRSGNPSFGSNPAHAVRSGAHGNQVFTCRGASPPAGSAQMLAFRCRSSRSRERGRPCATGCAIRRRAADPQDGSEVDPIHLLQTSESAGLKATSNMPRAMSSRFSCDRSRISRTNSNWCLGTAGTRPASNSASRCSSRCGPRILATRHC